MSIEFMSLFLNKLVKSGNKGYKCIFRPKNEF